MNCDEDPDNYYISKGVLTFKIENLSNFAKEKDVRKYSEPVYIRGLPWKIFAISKELESKEKFLSCYVKCNGENDALTWSCKALAVFKILAQKKEKEDYIRGSIIHIFNAKNEWGYTKFIKLDDLMKQDSGWYDESTDSVILSVEIRAEMPHGFDIGRPLYCEMSHLLDIGNKFSDCTLIASDGKEFKVYKGILACRSPVFAAMFDSEMAEKNSNIVKIKDINGEILEQLLRFIYSEKTPKLEEMAADLMVAADKYQVHRLKDLAERKLIQSLEKENACEFLVLADLHSAKDLQTLAIEFIQKYIKEIMKTDGWKLMVKKKHAHLIEQILEAIVADK